MHEDNRVPFWQDYIRFPGKVFSVQAEPESCSEQQFSQHQFRLGILAPYSSHHARTHLGSDYIGHMQSLSLNHLASQDSIALSQSRESLIGNYYGIVDLFAGPGGTISVFQSVAMSG